MAEGLMGDETTAVILARMEGKLDLVTERQRRTDDDFKEIGKRIHGVANSVQALARVPDELGYVKEKLKQYGTDIDELKAERQQRIGAVATVKAVYGLGGAGIASVAAILARHFGV